MSDIYPVILCGGSGVRLWPLSRARYPKQFISVLGNKDESLLSSTVRRLSLDPAFRAPTLLCNNDYRFLIRDELDRAAIAPREIILEQAARNTAPAIAVAALSIVEEAPDGIMVVAPSDHIISNEPDFIDAIRRASNVAQHGHLVLFAIKPNMAHTGYGYIHQGETLDHSDGACRVRAFVEKPDRVTAERYLEDGNYFWNSGIFVFQASVFLDELTRYSPEIVEHARTALAGAQCDLGFRRLDGESYAKLPKISVDYAVMEKTDKAAMLPLEACWSDVGSWNSMWDISPKDADGNVSCGDTLLIDTRNSYVHAESALVSTLGVEDMIVVQTPDAVLVTKQDRSQEVGRIVEKLKEMGRREYEQHIRNNRPWGYFETLSLEPRFQVKLLHVKPGAQLSLQMHHHRSEHWIVVKGTALVTRDHERQLLCENESIYISATQWHQLENPGKVPLELIEVQIGSYLGEDDIIRKNDIYQRGDDETK